MKKMFTASLFIFLMFSFLHVEQCMGNTPDRGRLFIIWTWPAGTQLDHTMQDQKLLKDITRYPNTPILYMALQMPDRTASHRPVLGRKTLSGRHEITPMKTEKGELR